VIFSEHFGETCVTLLKRFQNDSALNFVQFFLDHSVVAKSYDQHHTCKNERLVIKIHF